PDAVTLESCTDVGGAKGVTFQNQGMSEEHRWGDIADYDTTIFAAYIRNPMGMRTGVAFEFARGQKTFSSGSVLPLQILINPEVRRVELEKLERCVDGRVVWVPIGSEQVMNERTIHFAKKIYDSGPNRNGDQFFRVRVTGADGKLAGWAIDQVHLRG